MVGTFAVFGDSLPIPEIDFLEDFPLLTLAVLDNFEIANFLQVPFGRLDNFPFSTGSLVLMLCLILIL